MRAVIHLNDYKPTEKKIVHEQHSVVNPQEAADDRAVVSNAIKTEWYPGGGNVHVVDDAVTEVAEMMDGTVLILTDNDQYSIENAELVTVHND